MQRNDASVEEQRKLLHAYGERVSTCLAMFAREQSKRTSNNNFYGTHEYAFWNGVALHVDTFNSVFASMMDIILDAHRQGQVSEKEEDLT